MEHWNISVKELFRYNIGTLNQINRATNTNFILLFLLTYIDIGNPGHTKQKEFKNCITVIPRLMRSAWQLKDHIR